MRLPILRREETDFSVQLSARGEASCPPLHRISFVDIFLNCCNKIKISTTYLLSPKLFPERENYLTEQLDFSEMKLLHNGDLKDTMLRMLERLDALDTGLS